MYVHLSDYQSVAHWRRLNPSTGSWQWVTNPVLGSGLPISMTRPLGGVRYVVRVFHKGMWLQGWGRYSKAYVAGPDGVTFTCQFNIQYITFSHPAHRRTDSFVVDGPVPSADIVAGYWRNGTLHYILQLAAGPYSTALSAYYDAGFCEIMPRFNYIKPHSTEFLVSVG